MARNLTLGWAVVVTAAALGAGAAGAVWVLDRPSGQVSAPAGPTSGLAKIVRTDLVTTQPVPGTIGYGPATTIVAPGGSSAAAVAQAQGAVTAAAQKLSADRQAAADQAAVNEQAIAQAQTTLAADQGSATKVAADQAALGSARAQAQQRQDQATAATAADQSALETAAATLQAVRAATVHGTVYTGLPAVGATVSRGQALYAVDGHPVPLLYGPLAMYRMLSAGCSGADVQELERNLLELGYANPSDLTVDGTFTAADAAAVRRWQAALGVPQTGSVALGDAVLLPAAVRVTALHAAIGGPVQAGQPILDVTSDTRVVTVDLNPSLVYMVTQGDAVIVDLPDGKTRTPGMVAAVSGVAQQQSGGPPQTANGAPQSFIPVTITFSDPAQVPPLDQAPVTVDVTTQSARNVLAVPVNALLALEGGGYALELPDASGGGTHLVSVRTGIFDNSQVEVSGPGLAEGMSVVVPR